MGYYGDIICNYHRQLLSMLALELLVFTSLSLLLLSGADCEIPVKQVHRILPDTVVNHDGIGSQSLSTINNGVVQSTGHHLVFLLEDGTGKIGDLFHTKKNQP